jgi:hypothetical protein
MDKENNLLSVIQYNAYRRRIEKSTNEFEFSKEEMRKALDTVDYLMERD